MLFNSVHYFFFAPVALVVFFALPSRFRNAWLLIASLYFYAVFKVPFLIVLLFSIVITHFSVRAIAASQSMSARRGFLWVAVLANLAILYFLKYVDFSFRAWNQILGLDGCSPFYAHATGVILPMGISFFTLQAIAYAVDVYRGQIGPAKTVFHFALFKSFFPQLVAGPIMRAKDLLHQFQEEHHFKIENFEAGLRLIVLGAFKKTFVADPLGHTVDAIYGHPLEYNWISLCAGAVFHGLQVYCDFSGYSDIAIGTGRILGFQIPENFRRPFLATSLTDMWSRWHISLSTWLRDYVYIPLGGNRVAKHREYINVFITMAIGGIWHGSDWTFLLWGLCHAVTLVFERIFFGNKRRKDWWDSIPRVFRTAYAIAVFSFPVFFFRGKPTFGFTEGVQVSFAMIERAFSLASGKLFEVPAEVTLCIAALFAFEIAQEWKPQWLERLAGHRAVTYVGASALLTAAFFVYSVSVSTQFIYFQF